MTSHDKVKGQWVHQKVNQKVNRSKVVGSEINQRHHMRRKTQVTIGSEVKQCILMTSQEGSNKHEKGKRSKDVLFNVKLYRKNMDIDAIC